MQNCPKRHCSYNDHGNNCKNLQRSASGMIKKGRQQKYLRGTGEWWHISGDTASNNSDSDPSDNED